MPGDILPSNGQILRGAEGSQDSVAAGNSTGRRGRPRGSGVRGEHPVLEISRSGLTRAEYHRAYNRVYMREYRKRRIAQDPTFKDRENKRIKRWYRAKADKHEEKGLQRFSDRPACFGCGHIGVELIDRLDPVTYQPVKRWWCGRC